MSIAPYSWTDIFSCDNCVIHGQSLCIEFSLTRSKFAFILYGSVNDFLGFMLFWMEKLYTTHQYAVNVSLKCIPIPICCFCCCRQASTFCCWGFSSFFFSSLHSLMLANIWCSARYWINGAVCLLTDKISWSLIPKHKHAHTITRMHMHIICTHSLNHYLQFKCIRFATLIGLTDFWSVQHFFGNHKNIDTTHSRRLDHLNANGCLIIAKRERRKRNSKQKNDIKL